jgi:type VI secretion system secreted protein VgrG
MAIEADRPLAFHCPLGDDVLLVRHLVGHERLGGCFEYTVTLFSEDHNLQLESLLGKHATVEVRLGLEKPRFFDGIVCEFGHLGTAESHALYRVVLRPWLWLLTRNRDCRVFQKQTALEIAKQIFHERGFSDLEEHLFAALTTREYCVQFRESDFAFITRLFEHEGIYYFFRHELSKHTLVLADSLSAHDPTPGFETIQFSQIPEEKKSAIGRFFDWATTKQVLVGRVSLNDYDFKKSRALLAVDRSQPKAHDHADAQVYEYPGHYTEIAPGQDNAVVRLEEATTDYDLAHGTTDSRGLSTGALFSLAKHPRDDQNRQYLVVATRYDIDSGSYRSGGSASMQMTTHVTALDSKTQFRPARTTAPPSVSGPQLARVVGPKANEIWTDEYARVKIQFTWDQRGGLDESSSCWVRVSQAWAGSGWGAIHIPRVGQEVVVVFVDGDLDRPLITGRVYNDFNRPPYSLPVNATQSGIKSHSLNGGRDNFNELRFEDKKGEEEVFLQAEKNLNEVVKNDHTTTVGANQVNHVTGNRTVHIEGSQSVKIDGNKAADGVSGSKLDITGDYKIDASKTIHEQAPVSIKLECGGSSILIEPDKITITAGGKSMVVLDANAVITSSQGTQVQLDANALAQASGGGKLLLDATVLAQAKGGAKVALDANVLSEASGGAQLVLNANALLKGVQATVSGVASAQLDATGNVKADPTGVTVTGPMVKVN